MRALLVSVMLIAPGCTPTGGGAASAPAGTSADPVEVCTRVADVCRLDGAKLGVCTEGRTGTTLRCASQH